ncbi:hypothetical protein D3C87_550220 [compost metagenome]|nr:hypothetical protein ASE30_02925 [Achromobacter sp. Root83]
MQTNVNGGISDASGMKRTSGLLRFPRRLKFSASVPAIALRKSRLSRALLFACAMVAGAAPALSVADDLPPRQGATGDLPPRQATPGALPPRSTAPAELPPRQATPGELPPRQAAPAAQSPAAQVPAAQAPAQGGSALVPVQRTEINDQAAYERLLNNSGMTLQWLWSAKRGALRATDENDVVRIEGTQANFEGTLKVKGEIVSIASDRFVFRGTILILDAPDKGRKCDRTGDFEFKATGKRKYWRLQQMESCGRLTDYVDIYY